MSKKTKSSNNGMRRRHLSAALRASCFTHWLLHRHSSNNWVRPYCDLPLENLRYERPCGDDRLSQADVLRVIRKVKLFSGNARRQQRRHHSNSPNIVSRDTV